MLVEGWLQDRRLHLITGREKSGKSTLIWHLVACLLAGKNWLKIPCTQTPVIYLDWENGDDYAWDNPLSALDAAGVKPEDVAHLWRTPEEMPNVLTADWLRSSLPKTGFESPPVVIVDAAGPAFGGMFTESPNWDSMRSEVHRALAPLRTLCHEGLCTVLVIHHNNKQDEFLGSVAWRSECDHCWSFKRPEGSNKATLSHIGRTLKQTDALAIVRNGLRLECDGKVTDDEAAASRLAEIEQEMDVLATVPFGSKDGKNTTVPDMLVTLGKPWNKNSLAGVLDRLIAGGRVHRWREKQQHPYLYWRPAESLNPPTPEDTLSYCGLRT